METQDDFRSEVEDLSDASLEFHLLVCKNALYDTVGSKESSSAFRLYISILEAEIGERKEDGTWQKKT